MFNIKHKIEKLLIESNVYRKIFLIVKKTKKPNAVELHESKIVVL